MTKVSDLEELLAVEEIHAGHFEEWERRATEPLAKMAFRLAADKEANHVRWVRLLIELAKAKARGREVGVSKDQLVYWIEDESGEAGSYERFLGRADEPWVRLVVRQLAHDEETNAQLLREVLAAVQ